MSKVAVVLFNLGGPDSLEAIRPFLFNLFSDPAIISVSRSVRWLLAKLISKRRAPVTRAIYGRIGGYSPLLAGTEAQARALETALTDSWLEVRAFPAMRYWHPLIGETVEVVKKWCPDLVVLLPLYPQFSSTTTGSSMIEWARTAGNLKAMTIAVCCWPTERGWIAALTELTKHGLDAARAAYATKSAGQPPRVLFSAHGLPKSVVAKGDPYRYHVEETVAAVVSSLQEPGLDHEICYQSRVGLQQWIGPATGDAIRRAGVNGVPVVLVPVTFVSEHSETLVELDIECRHIAEAAGVPAYIRVPTVGTHTCFVAGLARLVRGALTGEPKRLCSQGNWGSRCFCLLPAGSCTAKPRVT